MKTRHLLLLLSAVVALASCQDKPEPAPAPEIPVVKAKFCPNCGTPYRNDTVKFCANCGTPRE